MTDVRLREIALAKYIGYSSAIDDSLFSYQSVFVLLDPAGKRLPGPNYWDVESQLWERLAPRFDTDESLLSTLMKGLAGQGVAIRLAYNVYHCKWHAYINLNRELIEAWADSPIAAVFNCASQIPDVQALIEEVTNGK